MKCRNIGNIMLNNHLMFIRSYKLWAFLLMMLEVFPTEKQKRLKIKNGFIEKMKIIKRVDNGGWWTRLSMNFLTLMQEKLCSINQKAFQPKQICKVRLIKHFNVCLYDFPFLFKISIFFNLISFILIPSFSFSSFSLERLKWIPVSDKVSNLVSSCRFRIEFWTLGEHSGGWGFLFLLGSVLLEN